MDFLAEGALRRAGLIGGPTSMLPGAKVERFPSGAVRATGVFGHRGKPVRYDLITPIGLRRLAETMAEGVAAYGERNWEKGIDPANLLNHAIAHISHYCAGDRTEDHLAHAVFGLFGVMHFEEKPPAIPSGAGAGHAEGQTMNEGTRHAATPVGSTDTEREAPSP